MPRRQTQRRSPRRKRPRRSKSQTRRGSPKRSSRRRRYRAASVTTHSQLTMRKVTPRFAKKNIVVVLQSTPANVLFVKKSPPTTYITTQRFRIDSTIVFVGYIHESGSRYTQTYFEMGPEDELFVDVGGDHKMIEMQPITVQPQLPTVEISPSDKRPWAGMHPVDVSSHPSIDEINDFNFHEYPQGELTGLDWRKEWLFNKEYKVSKHLFTQGEDVFVLLRSTTPSSDHVFSGFSPSTGFGTFGITEPDVRTTTTTPPPRETPTMGFAPRTSSKPQTPKTLSKKKSWRRLFASEKPVVVKM